MPSTIRRRQHYTCQTFVSIIMNKHVRYSQALDKKNHHGKGMQQEALKTSFQPMKRKG